MQNGGSSHSAVPGIIKRDEQPKTPTAITSSLKPPYTPRPRPQQTWVHSCCSAARLERALADPDVSAIEADIMYGQLSRLGVPISAASGPVMAHPTWRAMLPPDIDLTFADFLERCLADGTRHLKLDFKDPETIEPCLELLALRWPQLHANGQAVWLNADVLPGPNSRNAPRVSASTFLPLCRKLCPHAVLSLGWCVGPIGPEEAYNEYDVTDMQRLCQEHEIPGSAIVFAASLRFTERCVPLFGRLLANVPESQLLLWTGTGEVPVHPSTHSRVAAQLATLGFAERVGSDVQIARSCCQVSSSRAVDCTFFWSRWSRWLCGCASIGASAARLAADARANGERQPLVREASNGALTPNVTPHHSRSDMLKNGGSSGVSSSKNGETPNGNGIDPLPPPALNGIAAPKPQRLGSSSSLQRLEHLEEVQQV